MSRDSIGLRTTDLTGTILAGAGFLLPCLAIYAPLALTPFLIIVAVALATTNRHRLPGLLAARPGLVVLAVLLAALCLWGLVSSFWSIIPAHSAFEGLRIAGISACGLVTFAAAGSLAPDARQRVGKALLAGITITLLILAIERFGGTPLMRLWHPILDRDMRDLVLVYFRFDRGVTVLVLMLWAALFVPASRWFRLALLIAAAIMTSLMISETAMIALGAGLIVLAIARFFPRNVAVLLIAGLVALSIAIPLATPSYQNVATLRTELPGIKWSGIHRLLIWRFASDRVAERPLLGWGMDSSRAIPGGDTDLVTLLPPGKYPAQAPALPLHPHNGALQLLLELGIPGLLLGWTTVGWIISHIAWRATLSPAARAGALALTTSCLTVGLLSFGVWQEWWQSTIWLAAAFFAATATRGDATPVSPAS